MTPGQLRRWRDTSLAAIIAANIAFVFICIVWAWPNWWEQINYEKSALTWFSSSQLLTTALVCAAISSLRFISPPVPAPTRIDSLVWPALSAAFVFLSMDERFQIHERLREGFFKPHHIGTHVPGVSPGDFLLILYAGAGLVVATRLWRLMNSRARALFAIGIVFALCAVSLDAADVSYSTLTAARLEQFSEELLETAGQMMFLAAFADEMWSTLASRIKA